MSDETSPQWGYSKDGEKVFDLKDGEKLPKGYYDSPAKVPGSAAMKKYEADGRAEGVGDEAEKIVGDQPDAPKVTGL